MLSSEIMTDLYPLKFKTIFKDKIWGGMKIKTLLAKDFSPLPNCGETWEISGVEGNISEVATGALAGMGLKDLINTYKGELLGQRVYEAYGEEFPLLIKFIDANDDLSVQVHPDDILAGERHRSKGKTEMWYVLQADEGASLVSGFNREVTQQEYMERLKNGSLMDILNKEEATEGDMYFIPAGRVHTIGKGLLIAEIQQTSDLTYRIYDFDRKDAEGKTRELHIEEALEAIDYKAYPEYKTNYRKVKNEAVRAVSCAYFTTQYLEMDQCVVRDLRKNDSFVIYIGLEGRTQVKSAGKKEIINAGECLLVPACLAEVELVPEKNSRLLETYIP